MENIEKLVRERRSVRTYDSRELTAQDLEKLRSFMANIDNPYNIPIEFVLMNAKEDKLTCPVVVGTDLYVGGKLMRTEHTEEAFGYAFEMLVLYAQSLGIGTVWLGGTMDRAAFEKAMSLENGEVMPCASALGYPAGKMSLRENMMRKAIKANNRIPFDELFFDGSFDVPMTEEKAGKLAKPLEMVRWAPSAVNKQPWRVVVCGDAVHFYLKRSKGFSAGGAGDMQKIDIGIAICHFALAAEECGISVEFSISDPQITIGSYMEYIASYNLTKQ